MPSPMPGVLLRDGRISIFDAAACHGKTYPRMMCIPPTMMRCLSPACLRPLIPTEAADGYLRGMASVCVGNAPEGSHWMHEECLDAYLADERSVLECPACRHPDRLALLYYERYPIPVTDVTAQALDMAAAAAQLTPEECVRMQLLPPPPPPPPGWAAAAAAADHTETYAAAYTSTYEDAFAEAMRAQAAADAAAAQDLQRRAAENALAAATHREREAQAAAAQAEQGARRLAEIEAERKARAEAEKRKRAERDRLIQEARAAEEARRAQLRDQEAAMLTTLAEKHVQAVDRRVDQARVTERITEQSTRQRAEQQAVEDAQRRARAAWLGAHVAADAEFERRRATHLGDPAATRRAQLAAERTEREAAAKRKREERDRLICEAREAEARRRAELAGRDSSIRQQRGTGFSGPATH